MQRLAPLFLVPLFVVGCAERDDNPSYEFDEPVDRVLIDVETGDVHVYPGSATSVDGVLSWRSTREPDFDAWVSDGTLHVKGDCPSVAVCRTDVFVTIPKGAEVEIEATTGDVEVEGVGGNLNVELVTGKIEAFDLAAEHVDAKTITGSVDLRFSEGAYDVMAQTTTGHIDLTVPNRAYDVDARVTTGDVEVRVDTSASADASIFAKITTGDLTIRSN
jgi:DUF4097 and DUF4098 domain-containing protein YvlB